MVKPGDNRAPPQHSNGVAVAGPSAAGSVPPESGDDFSFIVIDRSIQDTPSGVWSPGMPVLSHNGVGPSVNNAVSMQHSSITTSFPVDLSPEEVQKKLQDLLQENVELKETLQQNNLAMKQQFATLVTWQEDVVRVQQHHKEKFEETKVLIAKLKAENANLTLSIKKQPDVSKLQAENEELQSKIDTLQQKVAYQDQLIEENTLLKSQLTSLEQRLNCCMVASEAQVRAERRVCELTEEKQQLMRINDELTQTVAVMQAELATIQADSFVVVETEDRTGIQRPVPLPRSVELPVEKKPSVASSPDGVKMFCRNLDKYDEKLMISYQRLDQQMESFSHLFGWLQRVCDNLPSYDDVGSLKAMIIDMSQQIHETQGIIHGHRVKLDESRQQLGRLGSEFQELLQEWVQFNKQHKDIEQNNHSYQEVQTQGFKEQIDRLTAQLLDAQEKLSSSGRSIPQQPSLASESNSMVEEIHKLKEKVDNLAKELSSTKEKLTESEARVARQEAVMAKQEALVANNKSSEEVQKLREEIDRMTAELLLTRDQLAASEAKASRQETLLAKQEAALASQSQNLKEDNLNAQLQACQEKLTQCESKLSQHAHWLADRDAALAQMNVKLSQQDAKIAQKDTELLQAERKIKGLEQNVDGLSAQAEVYKMDFNEERESRQKLAADKERVVDDLRALQRRNQTLLEQLEDKDRQLAQAQQSAPVSSSARSSYNTIATPGRVRNQWPPETSERHQEPDPTPQYECPKCQLRFRSLQPLQNHVEVCIELDMYP